MIPSRYILTSMRSSIIILLLAGSTATAQKSLVADNVDWVFHHTTNMLQQIHYAPKPLNDAFAAQIFQSYLQQLDPGKHFFLQQDIHEFKKQESQLDDEMRGKLVQFYKTVNGIFTKRLKEAGALADELLKHPFSFTQAEVFDDNTEKLTYCNSASELKARWKNYLKYAVLVQYNDLLDMRVLDSAKKTDAQLEEKARQTVARIEKRNIENLLKLTTEDEAFNTYINSIINLYDPHSGYFLPVDRRSFQEGLSGIYYGIGAMLLEQQGKVTVGELIIGGPAWKSGQIDKGDVIVKVTQQNEKPVDVAGYAMSEIIRLTRGQKGTQVTITFKKTDGTVRDVSLKREALQLDDTFVKSAVIRDSGRIGYISFPKFYTDFGDANGRSCAADMAKELERLKNEQVQGIIIDIRNNTGGSLGEVINMVGLFIREGPVVQVKSANGSPYISYVQTKGAVYDGPVVVLVNELSASAAEIFAAAIQDYHRGIVIGSRSTYGKGSVQRAFSIGENRAQKTTADLGTLHVTLQKYYRITGAATQLKGIEPDIQLPGIYEPYKVQEKNNPSALAWDTIAPAPFLPVGNAALIQQLVNLYSNRLNEDTLLRSLKKNLHWLETRGTTHALQLKQYQQEESALRSTVSQIRKQLVTTDSMEVQNTTEAAAELKSREQFRIDSNRQWINSLKKDLFLSEAVYVLNDYIRLQRKSTKG